MYGRIISTPTACSNVEGRKLSSSRDLRRIPGRMLKAPTGFSQLPVIEYRSSGMNKKETVWFLSKQNLEEINIKESNLIGSQIKLFLISVSQQMTHKIRNSSGQSSNPVASRMWLHSPLLSLIKLLSGSSEILSIQTSGPKTLCQTQLRGLLKPRLLGWILTV